MERWRWDRIGWCRFCDAITRVGNFLVKDDFVLAMGIMGVMAGSVESYQEKKI